MLGKKNRPWKKIRKRKVEGMRGGEEKKKKTRGSAICKSEDLKKEGGDDHVTW